MDVRRVDRKPNGGHRDGQELDVDSPRPGFAFTDLAGVEGLGPAMRADLAGAMIQDLGLAVDELDESPGSGVGTTDRD